MPRINLNLTYPTSNRNATQNQTFLVTINITCLNNNCGEINATLDPVSQPVSCKEILDLGQSVGNGNYTIYPYGNETSILTYCDMTIDSGGWTLVFAGKGNTATYGSSWQGWYTKGSTTANISLRTEGKSPAYDYVNISDLMLASTYGTDGFVSAHLNQTYLALINLTGPNTGDNNGNASWNSGLRGNFTAYNKTGEHFIYNWIAIWVGDTSADALDRVVFTTTTCTAGDWSGSCDNAGAIGGEFRTSRNSAEWYYIYVRENTTYNNGKSIISTTNGTTPFYTNTTNPYNLTLNENESQTITWTVNATGNINQTYEFFVYVNRTSDLNNGNMTQKWNVTIVETIVDYDAPTITINAPSDNSGQTNNLTVSYSVNDANNISNCYLILNGNVNSTNSSAIVKQAPQIFNLRNLIIGNYNWSINCSDNHNNVKNSETKKFSIINKNNFTGTTTNLSSTNVSNITNFTIENPSHGKINFIQEVDLSSGANIDDYVNISFNRIEINSSSLPELNKTARLQLYNLTFVNPQILKDNEACSSEYCNEENYTSGILTFNVTGFSIYSARETPITETSTTSSASGGSDSGINPKNQNCTPNWDCSSWSFCGKEFTQSRKCKDLNNCKQLSELTESRACPDILFDTIVKVKSKRIYPGKKLKLEVNLKEVNQFDLLDILITYKISKNKKIIYEESETRAIKEELIYNKEIDTKGLLSGEYAISIVLDYGKNQTSSAEHNFKVVDRRIIFIPVIILITLLLACFIAYGWYRLKKHEKEMEEKIKVKRR